jgi:enamine deaminase RidA (YjgF/YER057c/UK114 family)
MSTLSLTPVLTADLPAPVGPYSPGIVVGNLVFVSGRPARTTVEVSGLPGAGLRVEIDAVGVLKQG